MKGPMGVFYGLRDHGVRAKSCFVAFEKTASRIPAAVSIFFAKAHFRLFLAASTRKTPFSAAVILHINYR